RRVGMHQRVMQQYLQNLDPRMVFAVLVFGAVTLVVFVVLGLLLKRDENPLKQRLQPQKPSGEEQTTAQTARQSETSGPISTAVQKFSRAAAKPMMPKEREEQSKLRVKLAHAGVYAPNSVP